MKLKLKTAVAATAIALLSTAASASHVYVTDPLINGVALDSATGFTNPTINALLGSTLNVKIGIYDHSGGSAIQNYTMHFEQSSGNLTLSDVTGTSLLAGNGFANSIYYDFDQVLTSVGTWTGWLQPIQSFSCPSYRYGNGAEGGGGCGGPSESIGFTLNVTNNVPEPGSLALLGLGLAGLAYSRKRKAQTTEA